MVLSRKRSKATVTSEYYNDKELKLFPAAYYVKIAQRSNGKSYNDKENMATCVAEGQQFAYLRRLHKHIVRAKMEKLFKDYNSKSMEKNGFALAYSNTDKGFYKVNEYGECIQEELGPVGYTYSLEDVMLDKGDTFLPTNISFDEFVDLTYFTNEIPRFLNVLSTLIRNRQSGVQINMSGNTISKNCPYFGLLGVPIDKVKQGDILTITHSKGAVVRFEYCKKFIPPELAKAQGANYYFGFDDCLDTVMITSGDWDVENIKTKHIDEYTWNSKRTPVPIYISNRKLYELSVAYTRSPVAYVREVNNTNGIIRREIKYVLSYDNRSFVHADGTFPCTMSPMGRTIPFIDQSTDELWKTFLKCIECGRFLSTDMLTGTEFIGTLKQYGIINL